MRDTKSRIQKRFYNIKLGVSSLFEMSTLCFLSTIYVYYCVHYLNKGESPNPGWDDIFRNKFFIMLVRYSLASIKY